MRSIKGVHANLEKDELLMLRARCLPATGPAARAQLQVIDAELDRFHRASPAFRGTQAPKPVVRPETPEEQIPYWALIREPVSPSLGSGIRRTMPINGPSKLQQQVKAIMMEGT